MNISYKITPESLGGHRFVVQMTVNFSASSSSNHSTDSGDGLSLSIPTWIPGSYLVRDFSKHVSRVTATANDKELRVVKKRKNRWHVDASKGPIVIRYEVYAHDLSVRGAYLDNTHGFFNGSSVFLCVDGYEESPVEVEICPPAEQESLAWRVATTLPRVTATEWGFGRFTAADYDELIDHPVEMGDFETIEFEVANTPHYFVLSGVYQFSRRRLAKDAQLICQQQVDLFNELPEMERYLFFVRVEGVGYGGLEHRSSTALVCSRHMLPVDDGTPNADYCQFLGLVSHEYFHLWNVKRIKPSAFSPYNLEGESYTEQLWVFEGITSYYDDLALVRSGVIKDESYFGLLAATVSRVRSMHGQKVQSLAESSYDAWVKFYKPDDNTPNAVVSYYAKGAMVALALDLTIRQRTSNKCSLDQVMRAMWNTYGKPQSGVPEDGFEEMVDQITGLHLRPFFEAMVRDVIEVPLEELFARFGLVLGPDSKVVNDKSQPSVGLGIELQPGTCKVKTVKRESCAEQAGISAGDLLVAIDRLQTTETNLSRLLKPYSVGDQVEIYAFRRDELKRFTLTLDEAAAPRYSLEVSDDDSGTSRRRRRAWLLGETSN